MKKISIIVISTIILFACDRESSPDGRSQIRDEKIQQQIDSLKNQNGALLDSISKINSKLDALL